MSTFGWIVAAAWAVVVVAVWAWWVRARRAAALERLDQEHEALEAATMEARRRAWMARDSASAIRRQRVGK